jgi:hypothetical protein
MTVRTIAGVGTSELFGNVERIFIDYFGQITNWEDISSHDSSGSTYREP